MPNDFKYSATTANGGPDNEMGTNNNYETITGARGKVARCIISEYKEIDGEGIGNRAWELLERAQDTPTNRQLFKFHTENAIKWLVDNGEIRDVEIFVDDVARAKGLGMLVRFFDVREGDIATDGFLAPWGKY